MTYLDDYQAQYKLEGVKLVNEMLRTVPPVLLNRSGVDELLYTVREFLSFCLISCNPSLD